MAVPVETIDLEMESYDLEDDDVIPESNEKLAEMKKELGNQQYKSKQYSKALTFYTEAINLCPESASFYGNRSACYMMLNKYTSALEDARRSVTLDPKFVKGWIRIAKCSLVLGDIPASENALSQISDLEPLNPALVTEQKNLAILKKFNEEALKSYDKKDYRKTVFCLDRALDQATACVRMKLFKAECLVFLGRYQQAQEMANDVVATDQTNADAIYVRGLCLYYQDNLDNAFSHFQRVLKLAPDHVKALNVYKRAKLLKQKKEEGNEAFKNGKYLDSYSLYSEALDLDPNNNVTNAKLFFNRATASSKLNRLNEAVSDCTAALKLDENYIKALLRRAKCYMDLTQYDEAVLDYEKACRMDRSNREYKKLLSDAKRTLKISKRKDYYKILGIDRTATTEDIKKAYRKRALVHHPDRHANASDGEKKEQEKKFKEVGEAYGILADPKKRARYDNGQDMEDDGPGDIDPNSVFQAFFGDSNPAGFNFGGGAYPGGFTFHFQ
uniref:J domain-containing protein n=1 Tax=Clastoptera arizonana TaxID=38151 RepID=A0A1B6DZE1_9HEMI